MNTRTAAERPTLAPENAVAFLSDPAAYSGAGRAVEVIETHMAHVFLVGADAYKLKKPAHYPYLDFRSPASRRRACDAEVRLNRRLAPDVYLGVVALMRDDTGRLSVGGDGEPVDWLVHMRRLPSERFLDAAMAAGTASELDLEVAAEVPNAENVRLSGSYLTKVFEGPFRDTGKWCAAMAEWVESRGKKIQRQLMYYTTCPRCAQHYGKNYVVIFAQV